MTKNIFLTTVTFALGSVGSALASPACVNGGTLQSYINATISNGGCQIGSHFELTNWAYVNAAVFSSGVNASNITVNYALNASGLPDITFGGNWRAENAVLTATSIGLIAFSLEALNNSYIMTGVGLDVSGSVSNNFLNIANVVVPTGAGAVTEVNCVGGLLDLRDPNNALGLLPLPGNLGDLGCSGGGVKAGAQAALGTGLGITANANISFGPGDNFVDVLKILTANDLTAAGITGFGQLSSLTQSFEGHADAAETAETPEPSSLALIGSALVGLGLRSRLTRRL